MSVKTTSCYPLTPVESSTIAAIGHNDLDVMIVRFKNGSEYQYADVPDSVYQALLYAESKGAHFAKHIRGNARKYPCEKLRDAAPVLAPVNEISALESRIAVLEREIRDLTERLDRHTLGGPAVMT